MFFFKSFRGIGKILIVTLLLQVLIGCSANVSSSSNADSSAESKSSASEVTPVPAPTPSQEGTTEIFNCHELSLEVTNVHTIRKETCFDGMETLEYDVYVVYPGATVSIINADMDDPTYNEDKLPHPQWGFLTAPDERLRIVDGMAPMEVTPDLVGVYNLEASIYVLQFEMFDESNID